VHGLGLSGSRLLRVGPSRRRRRAGGIRGIGLPLTASGASPTAPGCRVSRGRDRECVLADRPSLRRCGCRRPRRFVAYLTSVGSGEGAQGRGSASSMNATNDSSTCGGVDPDTSYPHPNKTQQPQSGCRHLESRAAGSSAQPVHFRRRDHIWTAGYNHAGRHRPRRSSQPGFTPVRSAGPPAVSAPQLWRLAIDALALDGFRFLEE